MTTFHSRWNAFEVLDIDPDSPGFTCVGHAKTQGRRCRNIIAQANRGDAVNILQALGEKSLHSADLDSDLESLAARLLCKRWHGKDRSQITSKVEQWKRRISRFRAGEAARQAPRPTGETTTGSNEVSAATPCLADTLESLRREIATLNERYAQTLQLAISAGAGTAPTAISSPASRRTDSSGLSPITRRSTLASNSSITTFRRAPTEPEAARTVSTQTSPEEEQRTPVSRTSTSETQASSATSEALHETEVPTTIEESEVTVSYTTPRPLLRQPLEGDCSICCENLVDGSNVTWCRGQCGQNFHEDCIDSWLDTQADNTGRTTCPYW